jgi:hypothetical protein
MLLTARRRTRSAPEDLLMRIVILVVGVLAVLLGSLWLLQGVGLVRIDPIFCVADCAPLEGPSVPWAIAGFVLLAGGIFALTRALHGRRGA